MENEEKIKVIIQKAGMVLNCLADGKTKDAEILMIIGVSVLLFGAINEVDIKKLRKAFISFLDPKISKQIVNSLNEIINKEKTNDITKSRIHLMRQT